VLCSPLLRVHLLIDATHALLTYALVVSVNTGTAEYTFTVQHIRPKNSGQKLDFAILEILEFECFPFGPFGSDPGFQDSCSEHISDPKGPNGKFMNSTPPFWDLSRESWGARSEPLPEKSTDLMKSNERRWLRKYPLNIDDSFRVGRARGYCNDYEDEDE
jgi:hypothetical protein